jgi:spore germination protein YaaH
VSAYGSPMNSFVFHDPSGRRARRAGLGAGLLLALLALIVAGFAATLAAAPRVPAVDLKDPRVLSALHVENAHHVKGWKPAWTKVHRRKLAPGSTAVKPLTVAFYVSWDERSRTSLAAHISQIDVLAPMWITLKNAQGQVDIVDDLQANALLAQAPHKPSLLPVVSNVHNDVWDSALADTVLLNPSARTKLVNNLIQLAQARGYAGYVFDLENLSPQAAAAYPVLVAEANAALNKVGREVWATAPFADNSFPVEKLSAAADTLVLMAYDQHWATGDAGPIAAQDWFEEHIDGWLSKLPPAKTIVALGSYGYDSAWTTTR